MGNPGDEQTGQKSGADDVKKQQPDKIDTPSQSPTQRAIPQRPFRRFQGDGDEIDSHESDEHFQNDVKQIHRITSPPTTRPAPMPIAMKTAITKASNILAAPDM
ncbi:hypothetical protein SDC9_121066 [bioreactor metagenome]|uniref:Uncharacterized protein n=1 Tax=bioreactor metagenome TaxID=1076179 RepID=A0A645CAW9_9ZZZZ